MVTPEKYTGEYESIGMVSYTASGSADFRRVTIAEIQTLNKTLSKTGIYIVEKEGKLYTFDKPATNYRQWIKEIRPLQNAVDSMYVNAKKMGADAIINFKIDEEMESWEKLALQPLLRIKYKLSGFAIKRK